MKKIYQLSISACALCALMAFAGCISCGDGDGDYQQACEEGDFVKAYKCAKSADAERYVILHEAMYALEQDKETGLMKIAFIAKEHKTDDWLFDELEDFAHQMGDEELAQKLSSMNPKKLRLASPSIDGPLYGFFEVQDSIVPIVKEQEYGDSGDTCLYVRTTIKKIKAGKLTIPKYDDGSPRNYVDFYLLFLNSDGATIYKMESYYGARFPDLEEMNVGDVTTVEFRLDENYKSGLYKYKIGCEY